MHSVTRRAFFRECAALILAIEFLQRIPSAARNPLLASSSTTPSELLVIRGGTPREMLFKLFENLGGIDSFIKPGQKVVIKANFSFNRSPKQATSTNPELITALVSECNRAGAKEVIVLDHTIENGKMCMDTTSMKEAVEKAGGTIKAINSSRDFTQLTIPRGKVLKKTHFSKDVLDADVFINVPIAKHHCSSVTTLSMKNLMGIVWDRGEIHQKGLHQCIADLNTVRTPDLIILDAYRVLMTDGPGGPGQIKDAGELIAGFDPVAIDTYGSLLLEQDPTSIDYIQAAVDLNIGTMDFTTREIDCRSRPQQEKPIEQGGPVEEGDNTGGKESIAQEEQRTGAATPETGEIYGSESVEEDGNGLGIPMLLIIPVLIVAFLIGIRMRKKASQPHFPEKNKENE
jgi:uncharacterized protein (DUF362 family)